MEGEDLKSFVTESQVELKEKNSQRREKKKETKMLAS